jgi:hypothetical protein
MSWDVASGCIWFLSLMGQFVSSTQVHVSLHERQHSVLRSVSPCFLVRNLSSNFIKVYQSGHSNLCYHLVESLKPARCWLWTPWLGIGSMEIGQSLTWHRSRILELPLSGPLDSRMAGHIVCYFSTNAFCFVPSPLYIRNLNYLAGSNSTSRKAHPEFGASL